MFKNLYIFVIRITQPNEVLKGASILLCKAQRKGEFMSRYEWSPRNRGKIYDDCHFGEGWLSTLSEQWLKREREGCHAAR